MSKFLIRNFGGTGYESVEFASGELPRSPAESYVPWALTPSGDVVYAKYGEHRGFNTGGGLKPYETIASQDRRRLCESALGMIALERPRFTSDAVMQVSASIKRYLLDHFWKDQTKTKDVVYNAIGHYFYTGGRTGFGRISETSKGSAGKEQVWQGILGNLTSGRLEQMMSIHDAVGRKVLPELGGKETAEYERVGPIVRQDWFDEPTMRGRKNRPEKAAATTTGGIATSEQADSVSTTLQSRNRGVDMFERDTERTRQDDADAYYDDVDERNLLFGAGISGTTGTLLQAAKAFSNLEGDPLKEYLMAIVGYLIGGGMHSYHETMAVASKLGVPYQPGKFEVSLPTKFTSSMEFNRWRNEFYDVVVLGGTHWRFNAGALPSRLNPMLKDAVKKILG